jgi:DNA-binding transcriptional ArsR family regulator
LAPDFLSLFILQYLRKQSEISKVEIPMREVIAHIPESIRPKSLSIVYYQFRQLEQEGYISMSFEKKIPTRRLVKLEEIGTQITALFGQLYPKSISVDKPVIQKKTHQPAPKSITDDYLIDCSESITNILHEKMYQFKKLSDAQTKLISEITDEFLKEIKVH